MGEKLFYDWRFGADGETRLDNEFNKPAARQAQVLVVGRNFGCGSSREHAAWALQDFGFRVIISTNFADIFRSNALKCGLLPIEVESSVYDQLVANPAVKASIDLDRLELRYGEAGLCRFGLEGFARRCLIEGVDEIEFLLAQDDAISAFEAARS